jgi:hypothetical protein
MATYNRTITEAFNLLNTPETEVAYTIDVEAIGNGFLHDYSVGFTDYTVECNNDTANDFKLFPNSPAGGSNGDAFYIGITDIDADYVRYVINIGTAGAGTWTLVWEYYNGSSWTIISSEIASPATGYDIGKIGSSPPFNDFKTAGFGSLVFIPPSNWVQVAVNGVTKYWIRGRISAFTSMATQPLGTQLWYGLYSEGLILTLSADDSVSFSESLVKGVGKNPTQPVSFVDTYSKVSKYFRTFNESMSPVDNTSLDIGNKIFYDYVDFTEQVIKTLSKNVYDFIYMSEQLEKAIDVAPFDSVNFLDAAEKDVHKYPTDSMLPSDNSSINGQRTFTDFVYFIEDVYKHLYRNVADTVNPVVNIAKSLTRGIFDSFSPYDSVFKHSLKDVLDSFNITEFMTVYLNKGTQKFLMIFDDAISFIDNAVKDFKKNVAETRIRIQDGFGAVLTSPLLHQIKMFFFDDVLLDDDVAKQVYIYKGDAVAFITSIDKNNSVTFQESLSVIDSVIKDYHDNNFEVIPITDEIIIYR